MTARELEFSMKEQRLSVRLLRYWDVNRQNRRFPEIQQSKIAAVEELWPSCCLISISHGKRVQHKYKYEYIGKPIVETYGRDLTGLYMDDKIRQFPGMIVFDGLNNVLTERRPREDSGYFVNEAGKLIKYRSCFLPFGDEKTGLTHIVAALSFRVD